MSADNPDERSRPAGAARTVVVADDDPTVREVLGRLLQHLGFVVLEAVDGREAVARVRDHPVPVALVLLDLAMPLMDGEAAFQQIRRLRPELPVVLMSGNLDAEVVARCAELGLAGSLGKPITVEELRAAVDAAVARVSRAPARP